MSSYAQAAAPNQLIFSGTEGYFTNDASGGAGLKAQGIGIATEDRV